MITIMKDPPEILPFLPMYMEQNCNESDCPHPAKKHISAPLAVFPITPNTTTESEWKYSTPKDHLHTSTCSEGGTGFTNSKGENTRVSNHTASKSSSFNITQLGSTFKPMD